MSERRADEATRDVVNWLKCEYMKDRVGETFPGVITAVTGFGLFVELTDIYVEGMVHVSALPGDYYHFDPVHHRLSGERTGRSFRLGDTVEVRVMRVDLEQRKIDFDMSENALKAPIGRKQRSTEPAAPAPAAKIGVGAKAKAAEPVQEERSARRAKKGETSEAYFSSHAAANNAEVRKSREMKKALMSDAKHAHASGKPAGKSSGKSDKPTKHRKGPPKSGAGGPGRGKPCGGRPGRAPRAGCLGRRRAPGRGRRGEPEPGLGRGDARRAAGSHRRRATAAGAGWGHRPAQPWRLPAYCGCRRCAGGDRAEGQVGDPDGRRAQGRLRRRRGDPAGGGDQPRADPGKAAAARPVDRRHRRRGAAGAVPAGHDRADRAGHGRGRQGHAPPDPRALRLPGAGLPAKDRKAVPVPNLQPSEDHWPGFGSGTGTVSRSFAGKPAPTRPMQSHRAAQYFTNLLACPTALLYNCAPCPGHTCLVQDKTYSVIHSLSDRFVGRLQPALAELEDNFRYNDAVIRNLVIRRDEAVTGQSEMLKAEENRSERRERRDRPEHADSAEGDDSNDSDNSDNADE
ncbi:hypothetical protein L1887_53792 [Cichorium endivia]|nr:hypothetical protein L1887_53792 [Cichorium endivia]